MVTVPLAIFQTAMVQLESLHEQRATSGIHQRNPQQGFPMLSHAAHASIPVATQRMIIVISLFMPASRRCAATGPRRPPQA